MGISEGKILAIDIVSKKILNKIMIFDVNNIYQRY